MEKKALPPFLRARGLATLPSFDLMMFLCFAYCLDSVR